MGQALSAETTLEVYVRSLTPSKNRQLDGILDRVDRLETTGVLADSTVHVVGEAVCPRTAMATDAGQHVCERVEEFRDWARRTDRRIESFFPTRTVRHGIIGDDYEKIVFPTVAIAEFVQGELAFVTPCTDGEVALTPGDRLDELAAASPDEDIDRRPTSG